MVKEIQKRAGQRDDKEKQGEEGGAQVRARKRFSRTKHLFI